MVMTEDLDEEAIERLIVSIDPTFALVPSQVDDEISDVLWYLLSEKGEPRACQVAIQVHRPSILNIPPHRIPLSRTWNVPVVPLLLLLCCKLQLFGSCSFEDIEDIRKLAWAAESRNAKLSSETWLPRSQIAAAEKQLGLYARDWPPSPHVWRNIGFKFRIEPEKLPPYVGTYGLELPNGLLRRRDFDFIVKRTPSPTPKGKERAK
ncbi:hypothetical protein BV22DRAFT_1034456 [Leucogyrophana mollusca]|uniref:Uncharacterized protein n=1 Tax=Leucogyrophana mollusca TaxID=85980 RepID=A0ACB8BID7_9AGAM|nr:hypothetical protein BV22DRAFT_1034456 [Leucogyrophana mollusca]